MRLLVVEDEPEMAEVLRKGLEEENHRVVLATDGREIPWGQCFTA
jgi:DNA-binding response OmpR family regulator